MCIDMRVDMCVGMCVDMCVDMRVDMCEDMHVTCAWGCNDASCAVAP